MEALPRASACKNALHHADVAFNSHRWQAAKDYFTEALSYAESSAHALLKRGWCHYHMHEFFEAIADSGKLLKIELDNNIEGLLLRGNAYYQLGELEMAINHYRKALKSDPEHKDSKDMYRIVKVSRSSFSVVLMCYLSLQCANMVQASIVADVYYISVVILCLFDSK